MTTKSYGDITNFVDTDLINVTAASISEEIIQVGGTWPYITILIALTGTVSNTEIPVSIGVIDDNDVIGWTPNTVLAVKTMPDGTKVVDLGVVSTYKSARLKVALQAAISGGGSATVKYAFLGTK
jgi:hypothetical protein